MALVAGEGGGLGYTSAWRQVLRGGVVEAGASAGAARPTRDTPWGCARITARQPENVATTSPVPCDWPCRLQAYVAACRSQHVGRGKQLFGPVPMCQGNSRTPHLCRGCLGCWPTQTQSAAHRRPWPSRSPRRWPCRCTAHSRKRSAAAWAARSVEHLASQGDLGCARWCGVCAGDERFGAQAGRGPLAAAGRHAGGARGGGGYETLESPTHVGTLPRPHISRFGAPRASTGWLTASPIRSTPPHTHTQHARLVQLALVPERLIFSSTHGPGSCSLCPPLPRPPGMHGRARTPVKTHPMP